MNCEISLTLGSRETQFAYLASMQETGELCDFSIHVGSTRIQAHKCVLAASCEYFLTNFRFQSKAASAKSDSVDLTSLGCDAGTVERVVRSFYTQRLTLATSDLEGVLTVVDYLLCWDLKQEMVNFMLQTLTFSNMAQYFLLSRKYFLYMITVDNQQRHLVDNECFKSLEFRFHDYFIYQPKILNASCEDVSLFQEKKFFHFCSPLQVLAYLLNNLKSTLVNLQLDDSLSLELCKERTCKTFHLILSIFHEMEIKVVQKWKHYLLSFLREWHLKAVTLKELSPVNDLVVNVGQRFSSEIFSKDDIDDKGSVALENCSADETNDRLGNKARLCQDKARLCEVVVLVAPSAEMASQVNDVDAGNEWPLVSRPELDLMLYDVELGIWRSAGRLDFPISGAMQERHAWRTAFIHGCLYMFSLTKSVGLEYDITTKKWTFLRCSELFLCHGIHSPVKSIIPIAVGDKLIVLSMSRERRSDETYGTQQKFFEFMPSTKTFVLAAEVQDSHKDLPITQWTVLGNTLVTVKCGTMIYRQLSQVQYIHQFNAATSQVETHSAVCAMESGIKVFMKADSVYLLDKEGWCRSYSLTQSSWTSQRRFSVQTLASFNGVESIYPALTRITCQAGGSRWEVSWGSDSCNAYTEEVRLSDGGEISVHQHPPPPCHFGTALCPGSIERGCLDNLSQGRFEFCMSKNS